MKLNPTVKIKLKHSYVIKSIKHFMEKSNHNKKFYQFCFGSKKKGENFLIIAIHTFPSCLYKYCY